MDIPQNEQKRKFTPKPKPTERSKDGPRNLPSGVRWWVTSSRRTLKNTKIHGPKPKQCGKTLKRIAMAKLDLRWNKRIKKWVPIRENGQ